MAADPGAAGGLARRLVERLTKTSVQLAADDLHDTSMRLGATPIAELVERQRATVVGEVRSVALRPQVQVAAFVVELFDGSDAITLVWLGRRTIVGIEPGVMLRVQGRVTQLRGVMTIYNPAYEIVPQDG